MNNDNPSTAGQLPAVGKPSKLWTSVCLAAEVILLLFLLFFWQYFDSIIFFTGWCILLIGIHVLRFHITFKPKYQDKELLENQKTWFDFESKFVALLIPVLMAVTVNKIRSEKQDAANIIRAEQQESDRQKRDKEKALEDRTKQGRAYLSAIINDLEIVKAKTEWNNGVLAFELNPTNALALRPFQTYSANWLDVIRLNMPIQIENDSNIITACLALANNIDGLNELMRRREAFMLYRMFGENTTKVSKQLFNPEIQQSIKVVASLTSQLSSNFTKLTNSRK